MIEVIKTILAVIGAIALISVLYVFIRMIIAKWKYDPNDFYNNH